MSDHLAPLEKKLDQLLAYCEGLCAENRALRQRVAELEDERQDLLDKIDSTRERLEALVDRLPDE